MKISKTSWIILAAGVFIVVLAGLGVTRSGQMEEQSIISEELRTTEARLENIQVTQFQAQINELQEQLNDSKSQVAEVKERLRQTVISVDVADKFYEIARYYNVTVMSMSTTTITEEPFESVNCEMISLSAGIVGELTDIIDFVIGLNNNYTTGFVRSVQVSIGDEIEDNSTSVSIQMIVYSQKGS